MIAQVMPPPCMYFEWTLSACCPTRWFIGQGYVANGATVYICSRKKKVCDEIANELTAAGPGTCISLPGDLDSDAACKAIAEKFCKAESKLDVLVNCAGTSTAPPALPRPATPRHATPQGTRGVHRWRTFRRTRGTR